MLRHLRTRIEKLTANREPLAVLGALSVLKETGTAPPGPAGEPAAELWRQAQGHGFVPGFEARFWCYLRATGKTVADVFAEADLESA